MPWVKLDTDFWTHPKILAAGEKLAIKHLRAMCWSAAHGTSGTIPKSIRLQFGIYPTEIQRLLRLNLWEERDENAWRIHDWEIYNPSGDQAKQDRDQWEQNRMAMREKGRERVRRHREKLAAGNASGNGYGNADVTVTRARALSSRHVTSLDSDSDEEATSPDPSLVAQAQSPRQTVDPRSAADLLQVLTGSAAKRCSRCTRHWRGIGSVCDDCLESER